MRNRLRQAREERGISATYLAEMLQVHQSTIANWEAGRREITSDNLMKLADVLEFSTDYLLGRDIISTSITAPVAKDALPILHGQPVWTESRGWMLINHAKSAFITHDLSLIPYDEIREDIYLIPPALSNSMRGIGKPLALGELTAHQMIWVEPITTDIELGAELRGWYRMHDGGRLADNEYGHRSYLDSYGVKWLAFKEAIQGV